MQTLKNEITSMEDRMSSAQNRQTISLNQVSQQVKHLLASEAEHDHHSRIAERIPEVQQDMQRVVADVQQLAQQLFAVPCKLPRPK